MHVSRACAAIMVASVRGVGCVVLPESQPDADLTRVSLDQGWRSTDRTLFDHQSQGSVVLPYEWFMALEQPEVKFIGSVDLFRSHEYLSRFGFLPDVTPLEGSSASLRTVHCAPKVGAAATPSDPDYHCGLPVGLARAMVRMPETGEAQDVVGFTCAACHTSEIHHRGTAMRIAGASNPMDVTQFQTALGGALLLTQRLPFRFNRFADRVLKSRGLDTESPDYAAERDALRLALNAFMSGSAAESLTARRKGLYAGHPGGFGRTDALARIGNMVFGTEMERDDNLVVGSAPVKFPSIWDAPYFSWAQYNGSIEQSMVRNIGEALGVRARVDYARGGKEWGNSGEQEALLTSTVDLPGLYAIERLLRGSGDGYFSGLRSPVWPEAYLGEIAWERVDRGRQLYQTHCQGCHLPPLADLVEVVDLPSAPGGTGLRPRGEPVYAVAGDPRSTVIGLATPVPGAGATARPRMVWIANNHPGMLAGLQTVPFARTEFFLELGTVDLGTIRTDPGQALNFAKAIVDTGDTLLPSFPQYNGPSAYPVRVAPIGVALQMVTITLTTQFYDRVDAQTPDERVDFIRSLPANLLARDGNGRVQHDPGGNPLPIPGLFVDGRINRDEWNGYRAPSAEVNLGYRPHPLNGIWASPPYLHNGSVPNLYELLSPYEERSKVFYTGSREYDLTRIGYARDRFRGGFRYDTSVEGNSNYGHLFQEGEPGNGIIGPLLTHDDRLAIMEFLKTLCPPGTRTDHGAPGGPALCAPLPGLAGGR
jgi:mono/diheme cytochrome c family protein